MWKEQRNNARKISKENLKNCSEKKNPNNQQAHEKNFNFTMDK